MPFHDLPVEFVGQGGEVGEFVGGQPRVTTPIKNRVSSQPHHLGGEASGRGEPVRRVGCFEQTRYEQEPQRISVGVDGLLPHLHRMLVALDGSDDFERGVGLVIPQASDREDRRGAGTDRLGDTFHR